LATGILNNVGIKGIACAVPDHIKKSEEYNNVFGVESVQKFVNMTGIKTRHVALDQQCASDLCYVAAKNLLEKLNWEPLSIDALILITQTPDYAIPATACVLQHRLGLSEDCIAFDINLGCSAYVYGIWLAATMISTQNLNRVLLLVGDTSNFGINPNDSATAMIFGDGGTATALEKTKGKGIKYFLKTKGSGFKSIIVPAGHARSRCKTNTEASEYELSMDGSEIFTFSITDVPRTIKSFLEQYNIDRNNIDMYVFHQANLFILKHVAKKLGIPMEKVAVSIDRYGNTSGESIPLTLVDALGAEESNETIRLLLCGFGVGLSWGGIYLEMDKSVCLPMIYTNDYFKEG
jgi:3-oxoacyl-[acyl-carrier-protein] synthase III